MTARKRIPSSIRVAVRDGEVVLIKRCRRCGLDKICRDDATSEFGRNGHNADGSTSWRPDCKPCTVIRRREREKQRPKQTREANRRQYEAVMADPERKRRRQEGDRLRKAGYRQDPDWVRRARESARRWRAKKRAEDPAYFRDASRISYRLAKERQGLAPRRLKAVPPGAMSNDVLRLPADPYVAWLRAYGRVARLDTAEALATDLGVHVRGTSRLLAGGQANVLAETVDRALQNSTWTVTVEGRDVFTLDDLYPTVFSVIPSVLR